MEEPTFEVYDKKRDEVPAEPAMADEDDFDPSEIQADKKIEGWDNLTAFLDETMEIEEVEYKGEIVETEMNRYCWREVGLESAPTHYFCSRCDASLKTNSSERLKDVCNQHQIMTGH